MNPKILLIDIETAPNIGFTWGKWEQNVIDFLEHWYILSYAYEWLDEGIMVVGLPDFKGYKPSIIPAPSDKKLVESLHKLLDEADVVVAQNGDRFDLPKINTRFVQHGLKPPSPYKTVDTLKIARKFGFNANNLDDLARDLGIGRKVAHKGKDLWLGCMHGEPEDWKEMKRYNKHDVYLLREVYKKLLGWTKNHPNVGMWGEGSCCPKCGSRNLQSRGYTMNATTKYKRFQCNDCGGWGRTTFNEQETKPLVSI